MAAARHSLKALLISVTASAILPLSSLQHHAFAQDQVTFSPLPQFGYVGQPIPIEVIGGRQNLEYRALTREPDTEWNFEKEWGASPALTVVPLTTDRLSVDVQVRDKETGEMVVNKYLGDVNVLDRSEAVQLISWPIQRFEMRDVPSQLSALASEEIWRHSVRTTSDLAAFVRNHVDDAQTSRITPSAQGAYALTALQIVAGLWHYGNFKNLLAPGCVAVNETLATPRSGLAMQDYLASPIGCCIDYAMVLGALLQEMGVEHRIVELPTHVFNEVKIDGEWWTLDANINVAYRAPWEQVINGHSLIPLYRFQSASTTLGSRIYSDAAADIQTITLMQAAAGLLSDYRKLGYMDFLKDNLPDISRN